MARGRLVKLTDDMTTGGRAIICASEFFGTFILVFLGCMGCVTSVAEGHRIPHEQISWTFGLAVMVAVQCFGHISGSHINPVVTVAAATLGHLPLIQVPIYFVGQLFGALAGFGFLKLMTPEYSTHYTALVNGHNVTMGFCSPGIKPSITPFQGLLVEFTITLVLVLVCCAVWDSRNSTKHDSVAIRFGFTIAVLAMAGGPFTGANMNPVRSFAPALINGDWDNHWVYWIGPLSAAFFGALLYRVLFAKEEESRDDPLEKISLNEAKN